ncbi:MAG: hydroxyacid dehydrogenase [Phycisphaerae bacterium]|nr:hydroxyacid dehydrogenase [Phycisphaerae bacterium]
MPDKPTICYLLTEEMLSACFRPQDIERLEAEVRPIGGPMKSTEDVPPEDLLSRADIMLTCWGSPPVKGAILEAAKRLKLVMHSAGSVHHLVDEALFDRGVRLASCNHALAVGVAHMILGFLIVAGKRGWTIPPLTRAGHWSRRSEELAEESGAKVIEMFDIDVGVISASLVGRELCKLLRSFEVRTLLYDPYVTDAEAAELGAEKVDLETLLRRSDMVSLCAPALPTTRHMMGAAEFRMMKDHAIFINTSRGQNLDEAALAAELAKGRLFAMIDVTDPEPPPDDHPFFSLPNVIVTNHIAGHKNNGRFRQGQYAVDEILRFARGKPLANEITRWRLETMA